MTRHTAASVVVLLLIAVPLWIVSCLHVMAAMPPWWAVAHGAAALAVGGVLLACGSIMQAWLRERQAQRLLWRERRPCSSELASLIGDIVPPAAVYLLADATPTALCAGLVHPTIYLSTGLIDCLPSGALRAALAHEEAHRRRRDPLRRFWWSLLAEVVLPCGWIREQAQRGRLYAELVADRHARQVTSTRDLAHALFTVLTALPATSALAASHLHAGPGTLDHRLAALARPATAPLLVPPPERQLPPPPLPLAHLLVFGAWAVILGIVCASPAVLMCLLRH